MSTKRRLVELDRLIQRFEALGREYPMSISLPKMLFNLRQQRAELASEVGRSVVRKRSALLRRLSR